MAIRYPVVLVDLDRTLFDFDASERLSFDAAMTAVGIDPDSTFDRYSEINTAVWKRVEHGELSPAEAGHQRMVTFLAEIERDDVDPAALSNAYQRGLGDHGELYDGAADVLDALAEVAELALVTNGIAEVQRAKIDRLNLAQWFDAISISGELGVAKPDPAIFDHALSLCTSATISHRRSVLMVGDSVGSDMRGAEQSGLSSCWLRPHATAVAPGDVAIDHQIDDLKEVTAIVTNPLSGDAQI